MYCNPNHHLNTCICNCNINLAIIRQQSGLPDECYSFCRRNCVNICVAAALPRKYHQHNNPAGYAGQSCKCTNSCSVPLFPNARNFAPQCLLFKCVKEYRPHLVQKGSDNTCRCFTFMLHVCKRLLDTYSLRPLYITTRVFANVGLIVDTLGHATYNLFAEPLSLHRSSSARMKIKTARDLFTASAKEWG